MFPYKKYENTGPLSTTAGLFYRHRGQLERAPRECLRSAMRLAEALSSPRGCVA
jgi:hypothetical protein